MTIPGQDPSQGAGHDQDIAPPASGILVIYGATGDLTRRKLIPALSNLTRDGFIPEHFAVIGIGRKALTDEALREHLEGGLREHLGEAFEESSSRWLMARVCYLAGDFDDPGLYERLCERIGALRREQGAGENELHYLAIPPTLFEGVVKHLCATQVISRDPAARQRVVFEKPFGQDLTSARALDASLQAHLEESQIYRIDHYLGKETVQNLLVFRFGNAIFEPIWNRRYVDHVQITVAEDQGTGHRGAYYDQTGALRDMVPNHLMQLLSFIAMEPPTSFEAEAVRNAKGEVLKAVTPLPEDVGSEHAVRGQYGTGQVGDQRVAAYRDECEVDAGSHTETFAALRLMLDNWRWADVPFYLRTGKRMPVRQSEILIQFRRVPARLFRETGAQRNLSPNQLLLRIQPREAIALHFEAKRPGPAVRLADAELEFCYRDYFGLAQVTGYETLLFDALRGDATLFQRADSIEEGWRIIEPVLKAWAASPAECFPNYAAGTWGPDASDELLAAAGHAWRNLV